MVLNEYLLQAGRQFGDAKRIIDFKEARGIKEALARGLRHWYQLNLDGTNLKREHIEYGNTQDFINSPITVHSPGYSHANLSKLAGAAGLTIKPIISPQSTTARESAGRLIFQKLAPKVKALSQKLERNTQ